MRMLDVSPASALGGSSSRAADRELMQQALSNHSLRQMLRTTAHRPSSYSGGLPAALPAALVKALARRPPRVPVVKVTTRTVGRRMPDQGAIKEYLGELFPNELDAPVVHSGASSTWAHPRYSIIQTCTAPTRSELFYNFNAEGGCGTILSMPVNVWPPAGSENNIRVTSYGLPPNLGFHARSKTYARQISGSTGKWYRRAITGKRPIGQATPSHEVDMNTLPRARRPVARTTGYRRAAVQHIVKEGLGGGIVHDGPPTIVSHRDVPTKTEKKSINKLGIALLGAYHKLTEINDLVDALADAIPDKRCSALPGFSKLVCVVNNWDEIDAGKAVVNVVANEIEDRVVAALHGKLRGALEQAGGPNSTQVTQWVRQIRSLLQ